MNIGSATLHESGLTHGSFCFSKHIIPQSADRFFYSADRTISLFSERLDFTHGEIHRTTQNSTNPPSSSHFLRPTEEIYATARYISPIEVGEQMFHCLQRQPDGYDKDNHFTTAWKRISKGGTNKKRRSIKR